MQNGLEPRQVAVATLNREFVYAGDGRYEGLLVETDVTERVQERLAGITELVAAARRTLAALDEPAVPVGMQCGAPHECEFYAHCAPPAGKYPVLALGGRKERLFELMHSGFRDVRDVPEAKLKDRFAAAHLAAVAARGAVRRRRAARARERAAVPALTWISKPLGRPCRSSRARGRSRRCRFNGRATSRRAAGRSTTPSSSILGGPADAPPRREPH